MKKRHLSGTEHKYEDDRLKNRRPRLGGSDRKFKEKRKGKWHSQIITTHQKKEGGGNSEDVKFEREWELLANLMNLVLMVENGGKGEVHQEGEPLFGRKKKEEDALYHRTLFGTKFLGNSTRGGGPIRQRGYHLGRILSKRVKKIRASGGSHEKI